MGGAVIVAIVILVHTNATFPREKRDFRYVVPAGTGARLDRGQQVDIFPSKLQVHVGDRLFIRNDDDRSHHVGPFLVGERSKLRMTFSTAGTIQGECTLNPAGQVKIVVLPG